MGLTLCNGYPSPIWTSIAFFNPDTCGGPESQPFEMNGWWRIDPGSCALVFANDLADRNQFWYVFAHSSDGTAWSGPFVATVSRKAFAGSNWCWGIGHGGATSEFETIGYREIDIGDADDFTVTFVP